MRDMLQKSTSLRAAGTCLRKHVQPQLFGPEIYGPSHTEAEFLQCGREKETHHSVCREARCFSLAITCACSCWSASDGEVDGSRARFTASCITATSFSPF